MAEGTLTRPPYVGNLEAALATGLDDPQISREQVRGRRYRFLVISPTFSDLGHPERQRLVWDIADRVLSQDEVRDVAMIITMSPDEVG